MKKIASIAPVLLIMLMSFSNKNSHDLKKDSYPFKVEKTGQGNQSIIFIPGFASSGDVWNETRSQFEKDYTCYTLTMAGFAGVPPQPGASFKNWEKSIAQYIMDQHIEKPIVVGHSMGGGLALALAADYPDLLKKIVIVDALPCLAAMQNPSFKAKENNDCSPMVDKMMEMTPEQFYQMQKMTIPGLVADTSKQAMIVSWSVKSDRKTFGEMYCDFMNTDLREKIKNIKCPSLILLESYFKNFEPAMNEQYKNLKDADIQYADKGLHFIMYDDKEWYLKELQNFITK